MHTPSQELLDHLATMTDDVLKRAAHLSALGEAALHHKEAPEKWSALECLDHLNRYGDFYLPEIKRVIGQSRHPAEPVFRSGWMGHKSAMSMLPQNGAVKPMRTFKSKNPSVDGLRGEVMDTFIKQQRQMLALLEAARSVSLTRNKTALTLPLLRFRLGDTLRFVIYHNLRHIEQAERAVAAS